MKGLDAIISTQEEVERLTQRAHALTVQEAYCVFKSLAAKRHLDKVQFPQCQITTQAITEHFGRGW